MKELLQSMKSEAAKERERDREIEGEIYHTDKESLGYLTAKYEEAVIDRGAVYNALEAFKACVIVDTEGTLERAEQKKELLESIEQYSLMAAAEFVQLAATARKSIITINNRIDEEE